MHNFTIQTSTLRAVLPTIPKNDVRDYLLGACFDLDAGRIVATDGHRMIVCQTPRIEGAGQYIVPRAAIEAILKVKKCDVVSVEFSARAGNGTATFQLSACGTTHTGTTVEGKFPDYVRVVPKTFSNVAAQYNADYLADAQAALRAYHGNTKLTPRMEHNGTDPGVMHANIAGCFVVIMPLRTDDAMARDMAEFITDKPA